jgi:hypothetical protein
MFFFKKSEIILDCFTAHGPAYNYARPDHAMKYIPDWWKNTPTEVRENNFLLPTIKSCAGFIDYYKTGIIFPSWFDAEIKIASLGTSPPCEILITDPPSAPKGSFHPNKMFLGYTEEDTSNVKFMSPWIFKTKEHVNFAWSEPTWDNKDLFYDLTVLPGVLNFKYNTTTNINCVVRQRKEKYTINIKPQQPLAMLHPLTDKKIVIKHHLVSYEEYGKLDSINRMFLGNNIKSIITTSKNKKRMIDKADEINSSNSKCPFGFGRK